MLAPSIRMRSVSFRTTQGHAIPIKIRESYRNGSAILITRNPFDTFAISHSSHSWGVPKRTSWIYISKPSVPSITPKSTSTG